MPENYWKATKRGMRYFSTTLVLSWSSAHAQQVFVPSSLDYAQIPSVDEAAATPIGSLAGALMGRLFGLHPYPLHAGPVQFHPRLDYQFQYGDGILNDPGNQQTTALNTISPALNGQIGGNWFADVAVNLNFYSDPDFRDNIGYAFGVGGRIPFEDWTVSVGYKGSLTDESQVQTATQTQQWSHNMVASGVRRFASRISLELSASQDVRLTEAFNNQWTWSTLEWLGYQATPKTSLGFGVGVGYNLIDPGEDSIYQQVQGRVRWFPGSKLSFQLSGGVQFQEFLDDAGTTGIFPLYSAAIVYHPVQPTLLSFSASHSVGNSYYSDQLTETTSVGVGLNQRLLQHFYLSVQPAYNFTEYKGTFGDLPLVRTDDYFYLYVGLSTTLFKKLGTSVFYQLKDDQSSDPAYSFSGSLVGFSLNYRY